MEEALFLKYKSTSQAEQDPDIASNITGGDVRCLPSLVKNDQSEDANTVRAYKTDAVQGFVDLYRPKLSDDQYKDGMIKYGNHNVKEFAKLLKEQREDARLTKNIFLMNIELQNQINFLEQEARINQSKRLLKEERALKRKNAVTQKLRDSINETEFHGIIELVKQNGFVASRKKTALFLLYVTGLRVSNLLKLQIKHINDLLDKGKTVISLIKRGSKPHPITLSKRSHEMLKELLPNFTILMTDKDRESFLFTTQKDLQKPINRSSFDTELNAVLVKASDRFHKHIRTHTFRASIITDYLKDTPIDVVKEIIGHKDIGTTVNYKRGSVGDIQMKDVLKKLDKQRALLAQN